MLDERISYDWSEQQIYTIDDARKTARELGKTLETLSWLFPAGSQSEKLMLKYCDLAERIEIFCEQQLPF